MIRTRSNGEFRGISTRAAKLQKQVTYRAYVSQLHPPHVISKRDILCG